MFFTITLTSCSEEFLDTKPTDAISASDALATAANLNLVMEGLHRFMYAQSQVIPGGTSRRAGQHYWIPMFDSMAGNLIHSAPANNLSYQDDLRWIGHTDAFSDTSEQFWYQRYHVIASCNAIIKSVIDNGLVLDEDVNFILGQAHTYRAWAYHQLVMTYGKGYLIGNPASDPGVPLLFASESPFTSEPRSSVEEIYNQVEIDINLAIGYFENGAPRPTGGPERKSRLDINVANGIKARIALSKGDWQTAADAAALARQGYPLMSEDDWYSGFNTNELSEVIWGSHVIQTETTFFRSYFYLVSPTFQGSQNRANPKLIDIEDYEKMADTDYRKGLFLPLAPTTNTSASNGLGGFGNDPNYTDEDEFDAAKDEIEATWGVTNRHNTHAYMHVKFRQKNPGTIDPDDVILMRSSEMYLVEAEGAAMIPDIGRAQAALAVLGGARDSAYDASQFNTPALLMEEIKFQRAVELYGEGFSYHDYIRWDQAIDHTNSGASEDLYQAAFRQARPSTNSDWLFKIPQAEIDANPNISASDQN